MVIIRLPVTGHGDGFVDGGAVEPRCLQDVAGVIFRRDILVVIDVFGDSSRHILLDPSAQTVISIFDCASGGINLNKLILGIVFESNHIRGIRFFSLASPVPVIIVGVRVRAVVGELGDSGDGIPFAILYYHQSLYIFLEI